MIPLHLTISGFLSYRDPVEIDLSAVELACISGANGAGKSSLLDAITWTLFGQARKRDDSVINAQSPAAEVVLVFSYEHNLYRVQRALTRGKNTQLEFSILQKENDSQDWRYGKWKPLSERSVRETQARIENTLRLDYDTFVNASFFLQGKADQFTQQRPGDRKRILSSILGLEVWEAYREQAASRRKTVEEQAGEIAGRVAEIAAELAEEQARRSRLEQLESELGRLVQARQAQENALDAARKVAATLDEQRRLVEALHRQANNTAQRLAAVENRREERLAEKNKYTGLLAQGEDIQNAYQAWQQARQELERWDEIASRFREQEKLRQAPLDEINAERARLEQELKTLLSMQSATEALPGEISQLEEQSREAQAGQVQAEAQLDRREGLRIELENTRLRQAEARSENPRLKADMEELRARIDQLEKTEGAVCPVCGKPLEQNERLDLIASLQVQGRDMGDRYRTNQTLLKQFEQTVRELETQISALNHHEPEARQYSQLLIALTSRIELLKPQIAAWEKDGLSRLLEILAALEKESYAPTARASLAEVDAQLKAIGYDAAAHDGIRRAEAAGRAAETDLRQLEKAQAALTPLESEIADLEGQLSPLREEVAHLQQEHDQAAASLAAAEAQAPDLYTTERLLLDLEEQENRLRMEVGAARQAVLVLKDLKKRRKAFETEAETLSHQIARYRQLERAFSKDGVPALLIEQALPDIEGRANEILERLSGGSMSVRFVTQAAYKDKKRDDLKETLEIQISDGAGSRDLEMFSGGEAFRINFAIRLALSEILAQRSGARLQTLVIDEGFGSQDTQGRQRLVEAINLVRQDFAKILVITHIDELKDAFPNRIEVEKTERGSTVRVV